MVVGGIGMVPMVCCGSNEAVASALLPFGLKIPKKKKKISGGCCKAHTSSAHVLTCSRAPPFLSNLSTPTRDCCCPLGTWYGTIPYPTTHHTIPVMNCKEQHLPELELSTGQVREALKCILHTILLYVRQKDFQTCLFLTLTP